jgi:long-chain acyl-CoA synthetase
MLTVVAQRVPKNKCLGRRPWDPKSRTHGSYVWENYAQVRERRKNFGVGLRLLHEKHGVSGDKYGVGLFCNNRPEWQITGMNVS